MARGGRNGTIFKKEIVFHRISLEILWRPEIEVGAYCKEC